MLAVQYLKLVLGDFVEVDNPERISLEQRMDDGLLFLAPALRIDVVALVLRLDGELPAKPEQPLALQLVVHKPVADIGDRDVFSKRGVHFLVFLAGRERRRWRMKILLYAIFPTPLS